MLRHQLDPLFQPRSVLVVTDQHVPLLDHVPDSLKDRLTLVLCPSETLPEAVNVAESAKTDGRVDMVLACMPPGSLPQVLKLIEDVRPRALIILSHEVEDPEPQKTRILCAEWAKQNGCALLGPFAFGVQRPHRALNLSQHPLLAKPGRVALVAQSRSLMAAVLDWADDVHVGFSAALALGDEMDTRLADVLDYLAGDPSTDSIAIYIETVCNGREFMSALRSAARVKPVVVLRSGTSGASPEAEAAFDAALRRAGAVRVKYFIQLFSALKVFSYRSRPKGRRVAVFSNGEGPAQLVMDMAVENGPIEKAVLSRSTQELLTRHMAPSSSVDNPVVTHQRLSVNLVNNVINALVQDESVDGVIVVLAPDPRSNFMGVVRELARLAPVATKPVLTCLMGDAGMRPLRRMLDDAGVSAFRTPESTANAFGIHASYHYAQQLLLQIQPAVPGHRLPNVKSVRARLQKALGDGCRGLGRELAQEVMAEFDVPLQWLDEGQDPDTVAGVPCAIRVFSDSIFGPVVSFGAGGTLGRFSSGLDGVELAPLNHLLAKRMVQRSTIWNRLLSSQMSGTALAKLLLVLELLSDLVSECPEISSILVDPLIVQEGVLQVADVQISLRDGWSGVLPAARGYDHMAIHPYPRQWVETVSLKNGAKVTVRPIRPDDALALQAFVRGLSEHARYMRFVSMMKELTPAMLARYTQLDYHREFALVATVMSVDESGVAREAITGLAHYLRNPDGQGAEYALVVADDWQGLGLGTILMTRLIDAARHQGLKYVEGLVLSANKPMLALMTGRMGMRNDPDPEDTTMRRVWLQLH